MITGILVYVFASFFTEMVIIYLGCKLLNKKIPWLKMIITSLIIAVFICPILYLFITGYIVTPLPILLLTYILDMFVLSLNIIAMYIFLERHIFKVIIAGTFAYFIFYQSYMISILFIPVEISLGGAINQGISVLLLIIFTFFIGNLIKKLDVSSFIDRCAEKKKPRIIVMAVGFILDGSSSFLLLLSLFIKDYNTLLAVLALTLLFLFAAFYRFITTNIIHEENEKAQHNIIVQQTTYIQSLEDIQKDVRVYRHDFKNMMTGMYLDVKAGKTEAIEKYMGDMLNDFDQRIDAKIKVANQLMNIEIIELKSLLLTKVSLMQSLHIKYHLEVMYPLKSCTINVQDLIRCVGILLDNAIDEVKNKSGDIDIIITSQNKNVLFLINNSILSEPDLSKIWQKGYSTKGNDRGLGLYSYQQIANKYENVSCMSACQNNRFYQELRIGA